jgi:hypothetical protein
LPTARAARSAGASRIPSPRRRAPSICLGVARSGFVLSRRASGRTMANRSPDMTLSHPGGSDRPRAGSARGSRSRRSMPRNRGHGTTGQRPHLRRPVVEGGTKQDRATGSYFLWRSKHANRSNFVVGTGSVRHATHGLHVAGGRLMPGQRRASRWPRRRPRSTG